MPNSKQVENIWQVLRVTSMLHASFSQRSACSSDSEREDVRDDGSEEGEENEGFSEGDGEG